MVYTADSSGNLVASGTLKDDVEYTMTNGYKRWDELGDKKVQEAATGKKSFTWKFSEFPVAYSGGEGGWTGEWLDPMYDGALTLTAAAASALIFAF